MATITASGRTCEHFTAPISLPNRTLAKEPSLDAPGQHVDGLASGVADQPGQVRPRPPNRSMRLGSNQRWVNRHYRPAAKCRYLGQRRDSSEYAHVFGMTRSPEVRLWWTAPHWSALELVDRKAFLMASARSCSGRAPSRSPRSRRTAAR